MPELAPRLNIQQNRRSDGRRTVVERRPVHLRFHTRAQQGTPFDSRIAALRLVWPTASSPAAAPVVPRKGSGAGPVRLKVQMRHLFVTDPAGYQAEQRASQRAYCLLSPHRLRLQRIVPHWNNQFRLEGYPVGEADVAGLSPLVHDHINMLGRYSF